MTRATRNAEIVTLPSDAKPRPIAKRNGKPAWLNAPERMRAPVPMSEWCRRHEAANDEPGLLARFGQKLRAMKGRRL